MKYALLVAAVFALILCGCRVSGQPGTIAKEPASTAPSAESPLPADENTRPDPSQVTKPDSGKPQLYCLVANREEAVEIAKLYGIELASCYDGLATFRTDEDPRSVIQRGQQQGWPELSLNYTITTFQ